MKSDFVAAGMCSTGKGDRLLDMERSEQMGEGHSGRKAAQRHMALKAWG